MTDSLNILSHYNLQNADYQLISGGLINQTWKITAADKTAFVLQRINHHVFTQPQDIDFNHRQMADFLAQDSPDYLFVAPMKNTEGGTLTFFEDGYYYRLLPFIADSHTIAVVETPEQAYEAAAQFGFFTQKLRDFDAQTLKNTIPDFHNLTLRYKQFQKAFLIGNPKRKAETMPLILELKNQSEILTTFDKIRKSRHFKKRVTHHDTKISNVLFDSNQKGLCVIDLDTTMSGYFISDVGDMMRTYLSPVSEEEADFSKIEVRKPFYEAIVAGYSEAMKDALSESERQFFGYAGQFMVFMQALRFLTDYLNDDVYYGAKYQTHNWVRAQNQVVLLRRLNEII
jgi:Phosphotransferase enzyme family